MNGTADIFGRIFLVVLLAAVCVGGSPGPGRAQVSSYTMGDFSSTPINLTSSTTPLVMINASNDHQLFFKAYNDYADLDGDGTPDTTYKNNIDYYGYFDSYKCYNYNTTSLRFEPVAVTADKYCTGANDAYWSGNFLNWVSMSRIDVIDKVLFGGHRRVDTSTTTVLERAYLPHDAHSWAKYYDGPDLADLTPFTLANTGTSSSANSVSSLATSATSRTIVGSGNDVSFTLASGVINNGDYVSAYPSGSSGTFMKGNATVSGSTVTVHVASSSGSGTYARWKLYPRKAFAYSGGSWAAGDWVRVARHSASSVYMKGKIVSVGGGTMYLDVWDASGATSSSYNDWDITDLQDSGITLCNTTDVNMANYGNHTYSQTYTEPPLIKVARGNYSLWAGQERWQCTWDSGASFDNHPASNGNVPDSSGIPAYSASPTYSAGLGQKNYVARVQTCVAGLIGKEKCKQYPNGDYKPIGLLQAYGDDNQLYFGMIAGTYDKHVSGGEVIRNIGSMQNEVNVNTDGTFSAVAASAGGPIAGPSYNGADGLINAWSLYRIIGYNDDDGTYNDGDNCSWGLSAFADVSGANECNNWGNPFSEIYFQSIRYFGDGGVAGVYRSNSSTGIPGLPVPQAWPQPSVLNSTNSCARLNVINFNSSIASYDQDELDGASYGVATIWDPSDLPGDKTSAAMTDVVGDGEGITGHSYLIGETNVDNQADGEDQLCTAKTVTRLGEAGGLCPDAPRLRGSYRIAGLAYYAHVKDIRPDNASGGRALPGTQKVDTYSVGMANATPSLAIPSPTNPTTTAVTILPACRNTSLSPNGNCAIVGFKIVSQTVNDGSGVGTGKVYINWEDSEQGGDFDQDMWGVLEYTIDAHANTIDVTTDVVAESTGYSMGFGYVISGTTQDGFHAHSGIHGYTYSDPATIVSGSKCTSGCQVADSASTAHYTLGSSPASLLKDPLWYASKWGGFLDSNGNNIPDLQSEWDSVHNDDGSAGPDGIPDNYFYASNPTQLENSLNRAFLAILQRTSSGTAAAVVSNNVSGEGALFQAYYEPQRQDNLGNTVDWIGSLHALWLDSYGYMREDRGVKGKLENYDTDKVIETYYDETEHKTRVRRYTSIDPNTFTPYAMKGRVTAYDAATGQVTLALSAVLDGAAGDGPFTSWDVASYAIEATGSSSTSLSLASSGTITFIANKPSDWSSASAWIAVGDELLLSHFDTEIIELDKVGTIWNAREQLASVPAATIATQRTYNLSGNTGRYITTWIDANLNGVVDSGENIPFVASSINASNYGFFDMASVADTQSLVDYIRGKEIAGYRSRTIDYDNDGSTEVMRLGDIINSTPILVSAPKEALDQLFGDITYRTFKGQYKNRRHMIYVGANDGMIHAFNAGFYNSSTATYSTTGLTHDGHAAMEYPLGYELWAYVPMDLLPHLKWLKSQNYSHVYYVDGSPRVFDAKIFGDTSRYSAADHPGGWGTVLVVGMRFGGGRMTIDTAANGLGPPNSSDDRTMTSAYVFFDITNPEVAPTLLAEVPVPDRSFSTVFPAAVNFSDMGNYSAAGKWYLVFGSGPTDLSSATTTSTAKVYALDLNEIANPGSTTHAPTGCSVGTVTATSAMKIITCSTGAANMFVGSPASVDWNQDYKADTVYFGLVGGTTSDSGKMYRFAMNNDPDPANWKAPSLLFDTGRPIYAPPTLGIDEYGKHWVYFGSGRLFSTADQTSTTLQYLYGVKDPYDPTVSGSDAPVLQANLDEVSNVVVYTDGTIDNGPSSTTTLTGLEADINGKAGWYLQLPPIEGTAGIDPATRNVTASTLLGGVLSVSVYQPNVDACAAEGYSRLYGLYYKTGTAYSGPTVFGTRIVGGKEMSVSYINLGRGFASAPAIHLGVDEGTHGVSIDTQLSTSAIFRQETTTVHAVRSGQSSWRDLSVE